MCVRVARRTPCECLNNRNDFFLGIEILGFETRLRGPRKINKSETKFGFEYGKKRATAASPHTLAETADCVTYRFNYLPACIKIEPEEAAARGMFFEMRCAMHTRH
jgi:hypothetical protein